jgi:AraC family transcriptional regulator
MGQTSETLIKPTRYMLEPMLEQHAPTSRPAPRFLSQLAFSRGDTVPDAVGAPLRPIPLVGLVIELLDRAAETVDSDRAAAKDCITRASALLQREHSHTGRERGGATGTLARGGLTPWQVRQVNRHIDEALASTIRTDDCAAAARLSTSHFRRAFKVTFGLTFLRYVNQRRIERAQELMVMTDHPLGQIARRCGFADQSHFTRVFRRLVGPSPAIWRHQ